MEEGEMEERKREKNNLLSFFSPPLLLTPSYSYFFGFIGILNVLGLSAPINGNDCGVVKNNSSSTFFTTLSFLADGFLELSDFGVVLIILIG